MGVWMEYVCISEWMECGWRVRVEERVRGSAKMNILNIRIFVC